MKMSTFINGTVHVMVNVSLYTCAGIIYKLPLANTKLLITVDRCYSIML
jgi:hypothetical protein